MPKLKPETQSARRESILDAAELCFARGGIHRTTMQDICREAAVSPGALYVYFDSKEALIAGLCERERSQFAEKLERLRDVPDFLGALSAIGEDYFHDQPAHKRLVAVQMHVEAACNPRIREICHPLDQFIDDSFMRLFERLKDDGRIAPSLDIPVLVQVFRTMGDGLFWRRAVDPEFDARIVLPGMLDALRVLLNPTEPSISPTMPLTTYPTSITPESSEARPTLRTARRAKKAQEIGS